uniref:hypothetical protein n=1 Tax=Pedobacter sp. TaxID=1411316 RepID=UPI0015EF1760|nr:hypothetical protein [Pedobacter sp.]
MTGFGKFLLASVVSFFMMVGALGSSPDQATFLIALALLVWVIFVWSISDSSSSKRDRNEQIRLLNSLIKRNKI